MTRNREMRYGIEYIHKLDNILYYCTNETNDECLLERQTMQKSVD